MLRSMATVSGFTAMSRLLGFLRDILIAKYLGAGMVSDAFFSAFRFPNLFRRVFGEGAFNSAFVPLFARELEENGKPQALQFASRTFTILAMVLGVGTLIGIPLMAWIMSAVVPGFKAADTSAAMATGSAHEFKVNIKGARSVFLLLDGSDGSGSIVSGKLDASGEDGGILESYQLALGKLLGHTTASVPELDILELVAGGYNLRLMSVTATDELVNEGSSLVIVALVGTNIHIRIFGADGEKVIDKPESQLISGQELTDLRTLLDSAPFSDDSVLSSEEKVKIINQATSSATHTLADEKLKAGADPMEIMLPKGHKFTQLTGSFRIDDGQGLVLKTYRNHPGTFDLTVKLTQITFAYLMCMALVAHLSGVLNTVKIFGMPAAAPVLLNLVFLIGLLIVVPAMAWQKNPVQCGYVASVCVLVAGFVQLAALYITCRRKGLPVRLIRPTITPRVKRLFALMGPGVLSAGIQQINLLIGGIVASFQEGAVSYLYFSDRIYQLPLGMIGIALGVVLLPDITRRLRSDDLAGARNSMNRGIEIALLITFPAAVAMLVIPYPIVSTLFERNNFTAADSQQTALALAGFAIGLPGYVLIRVLQPGYFAQENTKSPMYMAGITVLVNIVFSLLLFPVFRHVGIAVATTISAWVNVYLLRRGLKGFLVLDQRLKSRLPRILVASLLMGAALYGMDRVVGGWFVDSAIALKIGGLAILVIGGMAVYGACAVAMKATSVADLKGGFKR